MAVLFGAPEGTETGGTVFSETNVSPPNLLDNAVNSGKESVKAAGFMLGLVKAENAKQAAAYRTRFFADAAALAVGSATGGLGGIAAKGIGPIARAIISGAAGGAGGGAAFAAVEGEDIAGGAIGGAIGGAVLGAPFGLLGRKAGGLAAKVGAAAPEPTVPGSIRQQILPAGEQLDMFTTPGQPQAMPVAAAQQEMFVIPPIRGVDFDMQAPNADKVQIAQTMLDLGPRAPQAIASGITPSQVVEEFGSIADAQQALKQMAVGETRQGLKMISGPRAQARRTTRPSRIRRPERSALAGAAPEDKWKLLSQELENRPAMEIVGANNRLSRALTKLPYGDRMGAAFDDLTKLYNRAVPASMDVIRKMGPFGEKLANTASTTLDKASRIASKDVHVQEAMAKKYTLLERYKMSDVLDGVDVATDLEMQKDIDILRTQLDQIAVGAEEGRLREFVASTGKTRRFTYRQSFYPHQHSPKTIAKFMTEGPEREAALRKIMETTQARDRSEAALVLERHLVTPPEFRYGHLQVARELSLPGHERDWAKVLPLNSMRSWKRIETAKAFGPGDEGALYAIKQMQAMGYDGEMASKVYQAFADKAPIRYQELIKLTKGFNIVSLLSTAGLVQLAQHSNIIAFSGFKGYMRGLAGMFTKEGREFAAESGAYIQDMVQDLIPYGDQSVTGKWLKFIGLTPLDRNNRVIAALAGRYQAADTARKLMANPQNAATRRLITQLGLNVEEVLAQGGILTAEQSSIAGQQVSHITQFRGSVLDLAALKNTTAGQFIYLFKNFSLQQMRFVGLLMSEAKKGNMAPALRYLAATGTMSAAVGHTARYLRGRPANDDPMWGYFEAMLGAGAVGTAGDVLKGMENGPEFFAKFLAGPTASQIYDLFGRDIPALAKGKPEVILHDALSHFPLVGRQAADYFIPLGE